MKKCTRWKQRFKLPSRFGSMTSTGRKIIPSQPNRIARDHFWRALYAKVTLISPFPVSSPNCCPFPSSELSFMSISRHFHISTHFCYASKTFINAFRCGGMPWRKQGVRKYCVSWLCVTLKSGKTLLVSFFENVSRVWVPNTPPKRDVMFQY